MRSTTIVGAIFVAAIALVPFAAWAEPVGTAFSYQGQLKDDGAPANGRYDFSFTLWDDETAGTRIGPIITMNGEPVNDGLFIVSLDFGENVYVGEKRWLSIGVNHTTLSPRQELTPTPHALALPGLWTEQNSTCPTLIGGHTDNSVDVGVHGATVGGGGGNGGLANSVFDQYGVVAGGSANSAGTDDANPDDATYATVGGGYTNSAEHYGTTIAGGIFNTASGTNATVGGGSYNDATGHQATIPGGRLNQADGFASLAAGKRAKAMHGGAFVWGDNTEADFSSTDDNQFLIRAGGGVGIGKNNPTEQLDVAGTIKSTGFQLGTTTTAGHVLTADGSGVGTWQAPVSSSVWQQSGSDIYFDTGDVGIGTGSSPLYPLHVVNSGDTAILAATGSGVAAIRGDNILNHGHIAHGTAGVWGTSYEGYGVRGDSDTHWPVAGVAPNDTGQVGVVGVIKTSGDAMLWTSNSGVSGATEDGYGVAGRTLGGIGVYGKQDNSGNYGYLGTTSEAVYGWSQSGYGGNFYSNTGTAGKFRNYRGDCVLIEHNAQDQSSKALEIDCNGTAAPIGLDVTVTSDFGKLADFDLNDAESTTSPAIHVEAETSGRVAEFIGQYASSSKATIYAETVGTGYAIEAVHKRVAGDTPAIYGEHDMSVGQGIGVKGVGGRTGVIGEVTAGGDAYHYGVHGKVTGGTGENHGVHGEASGGLVNYAGYFLGNVHCSGTLTKASGTFMIDHPLDPENKYLYHSFVESPDMMNIYNGNVVLDDNGEAVVTMPDWFQPLNRDFRYQLTCIGGFAQVYIAEEIKDNRFTIAGGTAGLKVSWQVTGVRQDPYANANRVQVEVDKPENDRGTYVHPEAWGVSTDLQVDRVRQSGKSSLVQD